MSYTIVQIVHLLAAIMFLGFVFTDVVILPIIKKKLGIEEYQKIKQVIGQKAIRIFPLTLLVIILSGGYMFSKYINTSAGLVETSLQKFLLIKVILALLIVSGVIYSLSCKILKKTPISFMKYFHHIVLLLGFFIVVFAKLMFT